MEQTFWPGSTKHFSGQIEVPRNSSPHVSILMQTYRRVNWGRACHFPRSQEVFPYLCFYFHCYFLCLTQTFARVSCASGPRRLGLHWPTALTGELAGHPPTRVSHTPFTPWSAPTYPRLISLLCSNALFFLFYLKCLISVQPICFGS